MRQPGLAAVTLQNHRSMRHRLLKPIGNRDSTVVIMLPCMRPPVQRSRGHALETSKARPVSSGCPAAPGGAPRRGGTPWQHRAACARRRAQFQRSSAVARVCRSRHLQHRAWSPAATRRRRRGCHALHPTIRDRRWRDQPRRELARILLGAPVVGDVPDERAAILRRDQQRIFGKPAVISPLTSRTSTPPPRACRENEVQHGPGLAGADAAPDPQVPRSRSALMGRPGSNSRPMPERALPAFAAARKARLAASPVKRRRPRFSPIAQV